MSRRLYGEMAGHNAFTLTEVIVATVIVGR